MRKSGAFLNNNVESGKLGGYGFIADYLTHGKHILVSVILLANTLSILTSQSSCLKQLGLVIYVIGSDRNP